MRETEREERVMIPVLSATTTMIMVVHNNSRDGLSLSLSISQI